MIREITRQQIDLKTAQGERAVWIEATPTPSYDAWHIPTAIHMQPERVSRLAGEYLPNLAAEIVIYGEDEQSFEPYEVARHLESLGYHNLFLYRAGKQDWFKSG